MKKPLVILSGPTGVGKSRLSISLAKKIGGEVVSADSMQVYRRMDIGTAKISREEMQGVPHHLIDCLDPKEDFNVMQFQRMAKNAMELIYGRGHIPILVGGTGFYIQSVLYDIDFQEKGGSLGKKLEDFAREHGKEALYGILKKEDPVTAETIHPNNQKKVIRAIEFFRETKTPLALHNQQQRQKESPYLFAYFVLCCDRERLYRKINQRVDLMMEKRMLFEVERLKEEGIERSHTAMAGLGYRQLLDYLDGASSLDDAVERIKKETRHFAKRQMTWFRREREVIWIDKDEMETEEEQLEYIFRCLAGRGILEGI